MLVVVWLRLVTTYSSERSELEYAVTGMGPLPPTYIIAFLAWCIAIAVSIESSHHFCVTEHVLARRGHGCVRAC